MQFDPVLSGTLSPLTVSGCSVLLHHGLQELSKELQGSEKVTVCGGSAAGRRRTLPPLSAYIVSLGSDGNSF